MKKIRLSWSKQHKLIEHFVAGTTARCASELVDVNRKTAAYYYHRLREIITDQLDKESTELFDGEIEVDDSYFGGQRKCK
jgi:transposase